jgi:phage terminase large subunit-like protein
MSEPTKELEALVIGGKLRHGGNPILRWMAGHVTVETDPAGNIKPSKKRSKDRIDGIVATVMALGRAMVGTASGNRPSVYESGGLDLLTSSPATDEETTETT